jgi:hypothetical protein
MTLCAVWFDAGIPYLASDSRILLGSHATANFLDISVKITTIPVTVLEPSSQGYENGKALFEFTLGLAAAGTVATTAAVKESLRALLRSLWVVPGVGEISMAEIAALTAAVLTPLAHRTRDESKATATTLALVGYCAEQNRGRAFVVRSDPLGYEDAIVQEIDPDEGPYFFGEGDKSAKEILEFNGTLTAPEVIRAVVDKGEDKSVGGRVQLGRLKEKDFQVQLVYDVVVDHESRKYTPGYFLAGLEVFESTKLKLPVGMEVLPSASFPFRAYEDTLRRSGYSPVHQQVTTQVLFDGRAARAKAAQKQVVTDSERS